MYGEYGRLIRENMRFRGTGELTVSYALAGPGIQAFAGAVSRCRMGD